MPIIATLEIFMVLVQYLPQGRIGRLSGVEFEWSMKNNACCAGEYDGDPLTEGSSRLQVVSTKRQRSRAKMAGSDFGDEAPRVWHKTRLRVPLYEVDLGHAVYHGNYFHLLELAREGFLRDLGYPYRRFMDIQLHLTVVEASCSYRRSLHYDDLIEVHTGVLGWRRRSMAFAQAIYRDEGEQGPTVCTRATLNMVCVRFTGQPTTLPAEFVALLKEWGKPGSQACTALEAGLKDSREIQ
jgi:acyl-CoA thioester hydrolase